MAGIDKTYTSFYIDYKQFKDWADKQYLPKGITFNLIGKYIGEEYLIIIS